MIRVAVPAHQVDWSRSLAPGWESDQRGVRRVRDGLTLWTLTRYVLALFTDAGTWSWAKVHGTITERRVREASIVASPIPADAPPGVLVIPPGTSDREALAALSNVVDWQPAVPSAVAFKRLYEGAYVYGNGPLINRGRVRPRRESPHAVCGLRLDAHDAPEQECFCGYHASYSPWEICATVYVLYEERLDGLLVVQAVGRTFWHENAWRAERYVTHAAVVDRRCVARIDACPEWDRSIPVVAADRADVPHVASDIAEEVRAMLIVERGGAVL